MTKGRLYLYRYLTKIQHALVSIHMLYLYLQIIFRLKNNVSFTFQGLELGNCMRTWIPKSFMIVTFLI